MPFDFACTDWVDRLQNGQTPIADLPIDRAAGDRAVAVYDNLRLPDVLGQPTLGDAGGDWFRDIVRAVYGSEDEAGERQIKKVFCLVPKKSSKTTNSAALGVTALLLNKVPNAQMFVVGPTQEVADTLFSQAKGMIDADPIDPDTGENWLSKRFWVKEGDQEIVCRKTKTVLKILSFDIKVLTGKIPLLVILDELHVMGLNPKAKKCLAQLAGGMITRGDTLFLIITTQSDDTPAGVFKTELEYARKVRDGKIKGGTLLPCLYEFPEDVQRDPGKPWRDPALWPLVLPNLGRSITIDRLVALYNEEEAKGPENEKIWASQHLNIQIGMGSHDGRWTGIDLWPASTIPGDLETILENADVVTAGVDGGGLDDILGLALIARQRDTREWWAWTRGWLQPGALEKRGEIASRLQDFAQDGDLVICETPDQDVLELVEICADVHQRGLFPEQYGIGLDPAGVAAIVDALVAENMDGDNFLAAVSQGYKLNGTIKGVERKLNAGTFSAVDQPMLAWCVSNAKTVQRGNAVMIEKAVSGVGKIDPLMALFCAAHLMVRNPEASGGSLDEFLANPVGVY